MTFWDKFPLTPPPPPPPPRSLRVVPDYTTKELVKIFKVQKMLKNAGYISSTIGVTLAFFLMIIYFDWTLYVLCCGGPVWFFSIAFLLESLIKK